MPYYCLILYTSSYFYNYLIFFLCTFFLSLFYSFLLLLMVFLLSANTFLARSFSGSPKRSQLPYRSYSSWWWRWFCPFGIYCKRYIFSSWTNAWWFYLHVVVVCVPYSSCRFFDDFLNLSALLRFGIQLLTACFLFLFSPLSLSWLLFPLIIAITAVINFYYFMDGLDGLVSAA